MGKRVYQDIEIRGVVYPDANAAAAALGVTAGQVRMAVRKDRLDGLGTRPVLRPVTIRGVTYPNFNAAGKALGVNPNTVRAAYRNGTLHRVGTGRAGPGRYWHWNDDAWLWMAWRNFLFRAKTGCWLRGHEWVPNRYSDGDRCDRCFKHRGQR